LALGENNVVDDGVVEFRDIPSAPVDAASIYLSAYQEAVPLHPAM